MLDEAGAIEDARIGLLSVSDAPVLAESSAELLRGKRPSEQLVASAAEAAAEAVDPPSDIHASADYRRHLVGVLVRRTLARALARATEATA